MKLYLLRHASAVDIAATDAARDLSARGQVEAFKAGKALGRLGIQLAAIAASPLDRAQQTAAIIAKELKFGDPITTLGELLNGTPTAQLLQAIRSRGWTGDWLLVGHMPSLAGHLGELTGQTPASGFTPAGCACVDLPRLQLGAGNLLWFKNYTQLTSA